jgi:hypothetical protein
MANWKKVIVSGSAAELSSLSLDTALTVANGGTGASTLTDGGVLLGSGTGAVTALGQATNGQLVIGSTGGDPQLATLTQGTGVTITNTAGGIEIAAAGSGGTVTSVGGTGTVNGLTLTGVVTTSGSITLGGTLGSIANSQLTNNTVSYGGVTVALGSAVAQPAFDLTSATSLPLGTGTTGTLATTKGGTGLNSYTTGDIIYSSAGNTLAQLGIGTAGQVLTVAGGVVSWATPTTGDITSISSGSGITITNGAGPIPTVEIDYVGTNNIILEAQDLAGSTVATSDKIWFSDGSNDVSYANVSDLPFTNTTGTVESVAADTNGGINVTDGTGPDVTLAMDINSLAAESIASGDFIAFSDATAGHPTKKESIDDVAALLAGTGLTSTVGAKIDVTYGSSANTAAQGNTSVTFAGTANEVDVTTTFTTVGGGGTVTYGLPSDVTIANDLTVLGDLEVSGTASFKHSENLDIADRFITLASGSTSATDGGIIVAQAVSGVNQSGEGYGFDASAKRWGVTSSIDNNSGAIVPLDYMVTAKSSNTSGAAPSAAPIFGGSTVGYGNIHVDSSTQDIYIYS